MKQEKKYITGITSQAQTFFETQINNWVDSKMNTFKNIIISKKDYDALSKDEQKNLTSLVLKQYLLDVANNILVDSSHKFVKGDSIDNGKFTKERQTNHELKHMVKAVELFDSTDRQYYSNLCNADSVQNFMKHRTKISKHYYYTKHSTYSGVLTIVTITKDGDVRKFKSVKEAVAYISKYIIPISRQWFNKKYKTNKDVEGWVIDKIEVRNPNYIKAPVITTQTVLLEEPVESPKTLIEASIEPLDEEVPKLTPISDKQPLNDVIEAVVTKEEFNAFTTNDKPSIFGAINKTKDEPTEKPIQLTSNLFADELSEKYSDDDDINDESVNEMYLGGM